MLQPQCSHQVSWNLSQRRIFPSLGPTSCENEFKTFYRISSHSDVSRCCHWKPYNRFCLLDFTKKIDGKTWLIAALALVLFRFRHHWRSMNKDSRLGYLEDTRTCMEDLF
ncbi:putative protein isoform X1 [Capsicum annuum]